MSLVPIRRALLSVSDKAGVVDLARSLSALNVELISTGGTARALRAAGLSARDVSALTGFPEIMDGRVKTLHPKVHGGLLGRRDQDQQVMAEHGIEPIDLLVVNLYPFEETLKRDAGFAELIENIDIGGPAMLRAAAKNFAFVTVVVDPTDYARLIHALQHDGGTSVALRQKMAGKAFAHTARYDGLIANFLTARSASNEPREYPKRLSLQFNLKQPLRYGENPHQSGAFYVEAHAPSGTVAAAVQLHGKELSFNNIADADAALQCVSAFSKPACVIVKHLNPCGVALAESPCAAYERAYLTDPTSAFGGIIAFNRALDAATVEAIIARQFAEVLIAPEVDPEALKLLAGKPNLRVLRSGARAVTHHSLDFRRVEAGLLVQPADRDALMASDLEIVTARAPTAAELADLLFAWRVALYVKSNAIVFAREQLTIGIGAGQMSRVVSTRIAALKASDAGRDVRGAVMASDAFFPFRDGIDQAAEHGIAAVIQPGGSMRDAEVIAAANEHNIAMVFTRVRHFRH